ncbi:MAG: DNA polymerase/3'-5' exonuclease PolX, partial [Candidatus Atribacteria bacterium]|nr:DNA polymerase/3'-5' exonuclease PolX [Candidatus Atribacteria bacterium]
KELGITSVEALEEVIHSQKLQHLPRFGPKSEEKIRKGIEMLKRNTGRMLLGQALPLAEEIVAQLHQTTGIQNIRVAGSLRRMKETIGDVDILVSTPQPELVMETFVALPQVKEIVARGTTKSSIRTYEGIQIDLRVVEEESFGAALQYFTGSKEHNIRLREYAIKKGFKINEYGIFRIDTGEKKGGEKEEDIYDCLGMEWIPPEMRENQGEIELARDKKIPPLVTLTEIKGDLHVHSHWSDGLVSIDTMAEAALARGYHYLAICDHTQSLVIASGLNPEELYERKKEIDRWNRGKNTLFILEGVEANILSDGSIDLPPDELARLPVVVAGLHSGLSQAPEKINFRLQEALHNRYVQIISHPCGRLINKRDSAQLDMDLLLDTAQKTGTFLEINAQPERLDLRDIDARKAKEQFGLQLVISTDSHDPSSLNYMRLGVAVARRAWLTASDILNTLDRDELERTLHRKRERIDLRT